MPCEGPVHLRRAVTADAAGIVKVHIAGWQKAHAGVVPDQYLQCVGSRLREEFWHEELAVEATDRTPWVALLDDRIIGFANGGITRDDDVDARTVEVYQLFVNRECWERGIRTNLMEHVTRDLMEHGFDRAPFWILTVDIPTRAFAQHLGWKPDGQLRLEDCGDTQVEQLRYATELR